MTTAADIRRRADFGARWSHLLTEAALCGHFLAHHGDEVDDAARAETLGRMRLASWRLGELEADDGPGVGDHFPRLLALLTPGLAAVRRACLDFAAAPGPRTEAAIRGAVLAHSRRPAAVVEIDVNPFADEAEAHAWAHHLLPTD